MKGPVIEFEIPVPASTKNSRILTRDACGRPRSFPSRAARRSMEQIRQAAREAIEKVKRTKGFEGAEDDALFGDDEVAVEVVHVVPTDTVTVRVWSLGPRIAGKSGRRRDLQNLSEGVCDGIASGDSLKHGIYRNDNQVGILLMRRSHWPTHYEVELDGE